MKTDRFLIVAPPPTPNGGLHVGHLSGPYLAADILKRECQRAGHEAWLALSTDDHQTYVDTRAATQGVSCSEMIADARGDIAETLERYAIAPDVFGANSERYCQFVSDFFAQAFSKHLIEIVDTEVAFDEAAQTCLVEAFIHGYCPHCLAESAGGICEACGHPNAGYDLEGGVARSRISMRRQPRLSIDLESRRNYICEFLNACRIDSPKLRGLLKSLLAGDLGRYTLSYLAPRGIPVPVPSIADQKINVWAEMYPAHFYHLSTACPGIVRGDRYLQCFGYDNSFFYAVLHVALSQVARELGHEWPVPEAFVVNRFYNLGYSKFSTSRGHVIWANEWAHQCNTDLTRLYLALHGPEHDEASFFPDASKERMRELAEQINFLVAAYNDSELRPATALNARLSLGEFVPAEATPRAVAVAAMSRLAFVGMGVRAHDPFVISQVPLALKTLLHSLCPRYANAIDLQPGVKLPLMDGSKR